MGTASGEGNDVLIAIEALVGSQKDDRLLGNNRGNCIYGLKGDDLIGGFGKPDTLFGGPGRADYPAGVATTTSSVDRALTSATKVLGTEPFVLLIGS